MDRLEVGDVVTRTGTDRHIIISTCHHLGSMEVECVDPGLSDIWEKGEVEANIMTRYSLVKKNA